MPSQVVSDKFMSMHILLLSYELQPFLPLMNNKLSMTPTIIACSVLCMQQLDLTYKHNARASITKKSKPYPMNQNKRALTDQHRYKEIKRFQQNEQNNVEMAIVERIEIRSFQSIKHSYTLPSYISSLHYQQHSCKLMVTLNYAWLSEMIFFLSFFYNCCSYSIVHFIDVFLLLVVF